MKNIIIPKDDEDNYLWTDVKGKQLPVNKMNNNYISFLLRIIDADKAGLETNEEKKKWKLILKSEIKSRSFDVNKAIINYISEEKEK